jgi:hypothetical protein
VSKVTAGAPSMAVNTAKQRHPTVPSSNNPPIPEWAPHYWYILRCAALQAHPDNNDNTAVHLMNFFASMTVVTPCPECREHYVEDWLVEPFTATHARSPEAAMRWVEDLRLKVEARVKAKLGTVPPIMTHVAASEGEDGAPGAPAAPAAPAARSISAPVLATRRHPGAPYQYATARPATKPATVTASTTAEPSHLATLRKYAIRASLHVTAANQSGRRMGCNCPTKSKPAGTRATVATATSYRRRPPF